MSMTKAAKERRELAKTVLAGEMREAGEVGQFGKRGEFGKRESMKLREEGWVPGRIQTRTGEVLGVKLGYADVKKIAFNRYLKNTLYTVNIQGLEPIRCLVRELQVLTAHRPAYWLRPVYRHIVGLAVAA
jgi:ribosomal protein L25 (general stress protein Ctc)